MKESILGIDLGTSSIKLLKWNPDGTIRKERQSYAENSPQGWCDALLQAMRRMELQDVAAIGLSSQVGTYIVNDELVIPWNDHAGEEELRQLKKEIGQALFLKEISMPHPDIVSYPMPRIMYMQSHCQELRSVCQPKDLLCEFLTGRRITDPYSWRGMANLEKGAYSDWALEYLKINRSILPEMQDPRKLAGTLILKDTGLPAGTPIYIGCNDFFAALAGMGIEQKVFDITGTSEHIGALSENLCAETGMVSGPFLQKYVHYGVTASSGASMDFCLANFTGEVVIDKCLQNDPPIFLPYLNGERAPIWDFAASGMFFGINGQCGKEELAYAVMEGIVFSIFHIYEQLGMEKKEAMVVTGGAAENSTLNELKAELFQLPVQLLEEKDSSALGAVMMAAVGSGMFQNLQSAAIELCRIRQTVLPTGKYRDRLCKRFEIYKKLYPAVKTLAHEKRQLEMS